MSSLINKVKSAMHSDKPSEPEGTHGPHQSRVANAADPRIDSDRDHRAAHDFTGTGENYSTTGNYNAGSSAFNTTSSRPFGTDGPATKTDGPHQSNVVNKLDPRVDSDRDHSRNMGANPHGTSGTGAFNVNETSRIGGNNIAAHQTQTPHTTFNSGAPEGTYGPHGSRIGNAVDPRVDSDLDGSRTMGNTGATTHSTATHGLGPSGATHHTGTHTTGLPGSGPAPNTAGPHKSDMMNKVDPRVDSNLDGSKTLGGDKTFSRSNETAHLHRDPTDAAQVPPSVLKKHIGEPIVAHDDHSGDHTRRHSVSHQEQYRGL